jgi:hypothetical protein
LRSFCLGRLTSLPPEAEAEVEGAAEAGAREAAVAEARVAADEAEAAVAEVAVSAVRELPVEGASRRAAPAAKEHRDHARRKVGKRVSARRLSRGARRSSNEEPAPRTRLSARRA